MLEFRYGPDKESIERIVVAWRIKRSSQRRKWRMVMVCWKTSVWL